MSIKWRLNTLIIASAVLLLVIVGIGGYYISSLGSDQRSFQEVAKNHFTFQKGMQSVDAIRGDVMENLAAISGDNSTLLSSSKQDLKVHISDLQKASDALQAQEGKTPLAAKISSLKSNWEYFIDEAKNISSGSKQNTLMRQQRFMEAYDVVEKEAKSLEKQFEAL